MVDAHCASMFSCYPNGWCIYKALTGSKEKTYGSFHFVGAMPKKMKTNTKTNKNTSNIYKQIVILRLWHQIRVRDIKKIPHAKYELRSASFRRLKAESTYHFRYFHFSEPFLHFTLYFQRSHSLFCLQITLNNISR